MTKKRTLSIPLRVYQCCISNIMYTGDIEAPFFLVHAVLDC